MKNRRRPPEFLILKGEELEKWLNSRGKTVRSFADALEIEMAQGYGLLSGEKAGLEISRRFIYYYGADFAHEYIDWAAMGMTDPFSKSKKRNIRERNLGQYSVG
jgi:hypothetical protein